MIIAVDCRHLDSSGIGIYIRGCLPYFLDSGNFFCLIGDPEKLKELVAGRTNAEILECVVKPFSFRELIFFPSHFLSKINKCDLYYSPFFNIPGGVKVPVYTTIHDIIFPDMPELASRAGLAVRMQFYRRAFAKSKKIFTVSEFSKSRIEYYSRRRVPVVVTHSALRPEITRQQKTGTEKQNTILFIGNIKKHKGLAILLEAFLLARAEGLQHQLVIAGSRDNFRTTDNAVLRKIDALGPGVVTFTGFISDEELADCLSRAALLVQPSLYEGFGLPPLEALVLGTHALISDIPVFREIYGEFPVAFFRAADAIDLKNKMMKLLFNKSPSSPVVSNQLLLKYTFEKTAKTVLRELE